MINDNVIKLASEKGFGKTLMLGNHEITCIMCIFEDEDLENTTIMMKNICNMCVLKIWFVRVLVSFCASIDDVRCL